MTKARRYRVLGNWAADRGYNAWDIFIGRLKWCRLTAVTKDPIGTMAGSHLTANIDWDTVRAVKLS